jgi:hypothetical protein
VTNSEGGFDGGLDRRMQNISTFYYNVRALLWKVCFKIILYVTQKHEPLKNRKKSKTEQRI